MIPVRKNQNWMPGIFNDFFDNDWMTKSPAAMPSMNVIDSEKAYNVELAVPGMDKKDCNIFINENDELVIEVEKKIENKEEDKAKHYLRREFSHSHFRQAFVLPEDVCAKKIEAKVENGVLNITLPKQTAEMAKKSIQQIEIN